MTSRHVPAVTTTVSSFRERSSFLATGSSRTSAPASAGTKSIARLTRVTRKLSGAVPLVSSRRRCRSMYRARSFGARTFAGGATVRNVTPEEPPAGGDGRYFLRQSREETPRLSARFGCGGGGVDRLWRD